MPELRTDGSAMKKTAFVLAAAILMAALFAVWLRYGGEGAGSPQREKLVITDTWSPPDGWTIPRLVVVKKGGVLVFRPGTVRVPESAELRVEGRISWHTASLEKTSFLPLSDACFSRLSVVFDGDGLVAAAAFSGYTGPVGRPRLVLSISAAGDLTVEKCDFDGVVSPPETPLFRAGRNLKISGCRYDSDNRAPKKGRRLAEAAALTIEGFDLRRLTGYDVLFSCGSIRAENLSLLGIGTGDLTDSEAGCDYFGLSLAVVVSDGPIRLGGDVTLRNCALSSENRLFLKAARMAVKDSVLFGREVSIDCEELSLEGSIAVAGGGSLSLGTAAGGGPFRAGRVACRGCLFSVMGADRRTLDAFADGGGSGMTGDLRPGFERCAFLLGRGTVLRADADFSACLALCAAPPPRGVELLPSDADGLAASLSAFAPKNEALASVIGKTAGTPFLPLRSPADK